MLWSKRFTWFVKISTDLFYRMIARLAEIGLAIEAFLLVLVIANTIMLSTLLLQTKDHLSTATILFIFNILFSNVLFTASFICLFSDLLDEKPFGQLSDEVSANYISWLCEVSLAWYEIWLRSGLWSLKEFLLMKC